MSILYVLIPLSLVLMSGAAWALIWAVDAEQFEDLEEAGRMPCADEEVPASDRH